MSFKKSKDDLVCVSACRTPFGRFGGTLKEIDVFDLGAHPIKKALERANMDPALIEQVWWGNGDTTSSKDSFTPVIARQTLLKAGIPATCFSVTFDQACTSGMAATLYGWNSIKAGQCEVFIGGGSTSFSQIPYLVRGIRWKGVRMGDYPMVDPIIPMEYKDFEPVARESGNLAIEYMISREEQDEFALASHQKYGKALAKGFFKNEMEPFELVKTDKKGNVVSSTMFDTDEQYRFDVTLESLTKLKPIYGSPTCTPGNAPGMNDGATAQIFMTRSKAEELGLPVLYTVVSIASIAMKTSLMPISPAFAMKKCLNESKLSLDDMKFIEINEAFACVPLNSLKLLVNDRFVYSDYQDMLQEVYAGPVLDYDQNQYLSFKERLNVNGSAVAIGHANTASGARIMMTAAYNLQENGGGYAACGICGGLTQGAGCIIWVE